jgi:hypothetical protein
MAIKRTRKKYVIQKGRGYGNAIKVGFSKIKLNPFAKTYRTETGKYITKNFTQKGKVYPWNFWRTRSSSNISNRLTYINERVGGKLQKLNKYEARLVTKEIHLQNRIDGLTRKAAKYQDSNPLKYQQKIDKILKAQEKFKNHAERMRTKIVIAKKKMELISKKYKRETHKLQGLLDKKIRKSQKRLTSGATTSCTKKYPFDSSRCLNAVRNCNIHGVDLIEFTRCLAGHNFKDINQNELNRNMIANAKSHWFRRFKRARHLREIKRISEGRGRILQNTKDKTVERLKYVEKRSKESADNIIRRSTNRIDKQVATSYKKLVDSQTQKLAKGGPIPNQSGLPSVHNSPPQYTSVAGTTSATNKPSPYISSELATPGTPGASLEKEIQTANLQNPPLAPPDVKNEYYGNTPTGLYANTTQLYGTQTKGSVPQDTGYLYSNDVADDGYIDPATLFETSKPASFNLQNAIIRAPPNE